MHWQILNWPLRTTPLMIIGTYTIVAWAFTQWAELNFWVAIMVMSLGLPVWYSVFGFLSLYAEKLLGQAATGLFDESIESETDLNPFQRGLSMKLFACHLAVFVMLFYAGPEPGAMVLPLALIFPIVWLSVMLDESIFGGFRPKKLMGLFGGLHVYYAIAILLVSGSIGYLHYSLLYANSLLNILGSAVLFLEANVLFGALLYWRRQSLNLHTVKSPEQIRAAELALEARELDHLFHELHTHTANGNFATAVIKLEAFMGDETDVFDPLMHERLLVFQDQRLCLEHAVRYLQRLVDRGEPRKAWSLMKESLQMDDRFRPQNAEALLALTHSAGREDAGLVNDVLRDFASSYPGSPLIPDALFRRARICIELLKDGATGMNLLSTIVSDYPEFADTEPVQRYRRRLKLR